MKIYIDFIFIQDTLLMSIILLLMSRILRVKISMLRILCVAALSSVFSIFVLVYMPNLYDSIFSQIILSFIVTKIAFQNRIQSLLQKMIIFWMMTLLLGGICFFMRGNLVASVIAFVIFSVFLINYQKSFKKQLYIDCASCIVTFYYQGKEHQLKALLDTGHDVKTAYGEDVIFVRRGMIKEEGDAKKRMVSYQTISGTENKIGIKIKNIHIHYHNKNIHSDAVIVSTPHITKNFDAMISYDLIEGGMDYGSSYFSEAEGKKIIS